MVAGAQGEDCVRVAAPCEHELRGGLPGWNPREATKNVFVRPFVAMGMVAIGMLRSGGVSRW